MEAPASLRDNRVCFNIAGEQMSAGGEDQLSYRILYIRFVFTHEYDKIDEPRHKEAERDIKPIRTESGLPGRLPKSTG